MSRRSLPRTVLVFAALAGLPAGGCTLWLEPDPVAAPLDGEAVRDGKDAAPVSDGPAPRLDAIAVADAAPARPDVAHPADAGVDADAREPGRVFPADGPTACTPSVEPGLLVSVETAEGKLTEATVEAVSADARKETLAPRGVPAGQTAPVYGGAFERPGVYTVTVSKPGFKTLSVQNRTVAAGPCHVIPEELTFVLGPSNVLCTADAPPGITVRPKAPNGQPVSADVTIATAGGHTERLQATQLDAQLRPVGYTGAFNRPGTYRVTVSAPGYKAAVVDRVVVPLGVCHVIERSLDVQMMPQ